MLIILAVQPSPEHVAQERDEQNVVISLGDNKAKKKFVHPCGELNMGKVLPASHT